MESLVFLIPVALVILAVAIRVLFWAVKSGQYDDLDTEGYRILFDDERIDHPQNPQDPDPAVAGLPEASGGNGSDISDRVAMSEAKSLDQQVVKDTPPASTSAPRKDV